MNKLLHSLPWSLALALAQAGDGISVSGSSSPEASLAPESAQVADELAVPPVALRLNADEEAVEDAGAKS